MKLVRHVGTSCRNADYVTALSAPDVSVVDTLPDRSNVSVGFFRCGRRLQMRWSPITRDLFDLAAMVYIADELAARGGDWRRHFWSLVPVADFEPWIKNEEALVDLLEFLTSDTHDFTWVQSRALPGYGRHRVGVPGGFDTVCMFSGGLDSLMGAMSLLEEGNRVLLVGHYADGVTSSAQWDLYQGLRSRYGASVELIQCSLGRSRRRTPRYELPEKQEMSHRARSFLFLAIGVAVARAAEVGRIALPENGLIALNPRLGPSRCGSLSTRTAHPRFLHGYLDLVRSIGAFDGQLVNPFLYMSKTDIVDGLESWQEPLVLRSVSCAHAGTSVRWAGKSGVFHCGYCVPCIYRRVALMATGLDRASDYCDDVLRDLPSLSPARQEDVRFLTRFAGRVVGASAVERQSIVVSNGSFPADLGGYIGPSGSPDYRPWAEMLSRWAGDFLKRLDEHASDSTKRLLGVERRTRARGARSRGRRRAT